MKNIVGIVLDKTIKVLGYGHDYSGGTEQKVALDPTSKALKIQLTNAGVSTTDHGALTGLTDDDHLQYLLVSGTRAMSGNLDMNLNQILDAVLENVGSLPSAGSKGRSVYLTTDDHLYLDTG
jgi:CO dehydrogenase/acetyl-CoA synthase delta subunit